MRAVAAHPMAGMAAAEVVAKAEFRACAESIARRVMAAWSWAK